MQARKTKNRATQARKEKRTKAGSASGRFNEIGKSSAQIVKDAAALLDEEVASGIVAAKQMQQRFRKERRIDPGDFKTAITKFQGDAHEVVSLLNGRIAELRSEESIGLTKRLLRNTHDVVDLAVESVNLGAEIVNQLAQTNLKRDARSGGKRRR